MKYIMVMSGKGGVGKTTIACNLAAALSQKYRVGFIDADLYGPNAHVLLGLPSERITENVPSRKLKPVKTRNIEFMSIAQIIPRGVGLNLPAEKVRDIILTMLRYVDWKSEYLVIDCPPGSLDINLSLLEQVGEKSCIVFVVQPHAMALEDLLRILDVTELYNVRDIVLVINMYNLFPEKFKDLMLNELKCRNIKHVIEIPWDQDLIEGVHPEKEYFKKLSEVVVA